MTTNKLFCLSALFYAANSINICYNPSTKSGLTTGVAFSDQTATFTSGTSYHYGFELDMTKGYYCYQDFFYNVLITFNAAAGDTSNYIVEYISFSNASGTCTAPVWDSASSTSYSSGV